MTVQGEIRQVTATIEKLAAADGKDGQEQWEVHLRLPWTPTSNKFPEKTWVDADQVPAWDARTKGPKHLEVVAASLKRNRDGEDYDGQRDWMWQWRILRELDYAPAAPSGSGGGDPDKEQRIVWGAAIRDAVALHGPCPTGQTPVWDTIERWAGELYRMAIAGPPAATGHQAPQDIIAGPDADALPFDDAPLFDEEPEPPPAPRSQARAARGNGQQPGGGKLRDCPDHNAPLVRVPANAGPGLGHPVREGGKLVRWCHGERDGEPVANGHLEPLG